MLYFLENDNEYHLLTLLFQQQQTTKKIDALISLEDHYCIGEQSIMDHER